MNIEQNLSALGRAFRNTGKLIVPDSMDVGLACTSWVNGKDPMTTHNLIPTEGRRYLLGAALTGASQNTSFYIAPFTGNVTPLDAWTAANFTANATEFQNYDEGTRVLWDKTMHVTASSASNAAGAEFTLSTGVTGLTLHGFGLLTASAKAATTGVLVSALRHDRSGLEAGDKLRVVFTMTYSNPA